MIFLPFENIIYKSNLSKTQILKNLDENIQKGKPFHAGMNPTGFPYVGNISNHNFDITRIIDYRNSFLPYIKGTVSEELDGTTTIKVTMRPHGFVLGFMAIWLSCAFLGCVVTTFAIFRSQFNFAFLVPFGMLLFGITLFVGAFKWESRISKKNLEQILNAKII